MQWFDINNVPSDTMPVVKEGISSRIKNMANITSTKNRRSCKFRSSFTSIRRFQRLGEWSGLLHEIYQGYAQEGSVPQNGEAWKDFEIRIRNAFNDLKKDRCLIVAHGGVFYALKIQKLIQTNIDHLDNCKIVEIEYTADHWCARYAFRESY